MINEEKLSPSERFELYITRWAERENLDPNEVKNKLTVKEYKAWIEKEYSNDYSRQERLSKTIQEIDAEDKCSGRRDTKR